MIALPFACSHHCLHHLSCCHHDDDHFPGVPTHSLIWPLPWSHPLPSHSCTSWSNIWGWCKRPFNQVMAMIRRGPFYRCCPDQDHHDHYSEQGRWDALINQYSCNFATTRHEDFVDDGGGNDVGGGDALHYRGDEHCLHWGWSEWSAKARRD